MKFLNCYLPICCFISISIFYSCQTKQPKPNPKLSTIDLLRGDIIMCNGNQLGEVSFSSSCKESVRPTFDLAVSLLHSFEYDEAEKAFVKVIDADPNCAMAYWGVAMSNYHALWNPPNEEQLKKGEAILKLSEHIKKSAREQAYLEAIGAYYENWKTENAKTRALKMEKKMEDIYLKYKEDKEAAIFYALALNSIVDPTDKSFVNQRKAGQILESIFPDQPNHPGIAHYIIHTYDYPGLAEKALTTARKYAAIAPASSHAQHMPSHIFTRLGLWDESIASNINSTSSAVCYAESAGFKGNWDEELHGMDYLVYAYLQKGDNQKAREQNDYLNTMQEVYPVNFKDAYAIAAIPARIVLENKDWQQAANLECSSIAFPWEQFPWQIAILHYARALGASHIGDLKNAEKEIAQLQTLHQQLVEMENQYQANQVLIQIKSATAWLDFAQSKFNDAIALMKEAADMEDNTMKHPVTPCEVLPCRELLGDMYLAIDNYSEAIIAFIKDLELHPNRFNGIYGLAQSYKKLGNSKDSKIYFEQLLQLSEGVDSDRPEIKEAKAAITHI